MNILNTKEVRVTVAKWTSERGKKMEMRSWRNLTATVRPLACSWIKMGAIMGFWVEMLFSDFCFKVAAVLKVDWTAAEAMGPWWLFRLSFLSNTRSSNTWRKSGFFLQGWRSIGRWEINNIHHWNIIEECFFWSILTFFNYIE